MSPVNPRIPRPLTIQGTLANPRIPERNEMNGMDGKSVKNANASVVATAAGIQAPPIVGGKGWLIVEATTNPANSTVEGRES